MKAQFLFLMAFLLYVEDYIRAKDWPVNLCDRQGLFQIMGQPQTDFGGFYFHEGVDIVANYANVPAKTQKTITAIEKFETIHPTSSDSFRFSPCDSRNRFVTQTALGNLIRSNLETSGDDLIVTYFIQRKRKKH